MKKAAWIMAVLGVTLVASALAMRGGSIGCGVTSIDGAAIEDVEGARTRSVWVDVAGAGRQTGEVVVRRSVNGADEPGITVAAQSQRMLARVECQAAAEQRVELVLRTPGASTVLRVESDRPVDVVLHRDGTPIASAQLAAGEETVVLRW